MATLLGALLLAGIMFVGSVLFGAIPLVLRLSPQRLTQLALLGSGLLLGTVLLVILPEGVETVVGAQLPGLRVQREHGAQSAERPVEAAVHDGTISRIVGWAVVLGFSSMMLIARLVPSDGHHHHHHQHQHHQHHHHRQQALTMNPFEVECASSPELEPSLERSLDCPALSHVDLAHSSIELNIGSAQSSTRVSTSGDSSALAATPTSDVRSGAASLSSHHRHPVRLWGFTPASIGLLVHAATDGIALGVASATNEASLEIIVFLAVFLHKAPETFGLCTHLLQTGLPKRYIRLQILVFSAAAPLMSIVSLLVLRAIGDSSDGSAGPNLRLQLVTGAMLLFSAGTFLHVATMHSLPEAILAAARDEQSHSRQGSEAGVLSDSSSSVHSGDATDGASRPGSSRGGSRSDSRSLSRSRSHRRRSSQHGGELHNEIPHGVASLNWSQMAILLAGIILPLAFTFHDI